MTEPNRKLAVSMRHVAFEDWAVSIRFFGKLATTCFMLTHPLTTSMI
jgi:hypothetical protein